MRKSLFVVTIALIACSIVAGSLLRVSSDSSSPSLAWFHQQGYDVADFEAIPQREIVLRLNQAVYSFCEAGTAPSDIDDMYTDCVGQCGGFAYVLRGLLTELGIETRNANLHNIPNQGNHTAVEALVDDRWMFVDPTFGVFFTENGQPDGRVLSLNAINFEYRQQDLADFVLQARKASSHVDRDSLSTLYNDVFDHEFMVLRNYQVAEQIEYGFADSSLNLDIPLSLNGGSARIGGDELIDSTANESSWLEATNQTLLDDDPLNDVSFNTSYLFPNKLVTLSLHDLIPGHPYLVRMFLASDRDNQSLEISNIGKGVQLDRGRSVMQKKGTHTVDVRLSAKRSVGTIMLRSVGSSKMRLFGIEVGKLGPQMSAAEPGHAEP